MRLSVPSYIIPGTYLENVRYIDSIPEVENIELLFFAFDEDSRALYQRERKGLESYLGRFSYTAHLPDILEPDHAVIVDETSSLVSQYIVHPPKGNPEAFVTLIQGWIDRYGESFLVENVTDRPIEDVLLELPGLGLCLDTGHALLTGTAPREITMAYPDRLREVHLHGVRDGKDHHSFGAGETWFQDILPDLRRPELLVHLEAFAEDRVRRMIEEVKTVGLLEEST